MIMGLLMVARIGNRDGADIGIRLIDNVDYSIKDVPIQSIKNGLRSGIVIDNLSLSGDKLTGTNGAYEKYPVLGAGDMYSNQAVTIIGKYKDGDKFKICRSNGQIVDMPAKNLINYGEKFGITNGKIVSQDGKKYISSINGKYMELEKAKRFILLLYTYREHKGKKILYDLPAPSTLVVYDTLNNRELSKLEVGRELESLGYDKQMHIHIINGRYVCGCDEFYNIMPKAVVKLDSRNEYSYEEERSLMGSIASRIVVLHRSRLVTDEVKYDCYICKDKRHIQISMPELVAMYQDNGKGLLMDMKIEGDKLLIRCATGINEYRYSSFADAIYNKCKSLENYRAKVKLVGGDEVLQVDGMKYVIGVKATGGVDIVLGKGIRGVRKNALSGVNIGTLQIDATDLDIQNIGHIRVNKLISKNKNATKVIGKLLSKQNKWSLYVNKAVISADADDASIAKFMVHVGDVEIDGSLSRERWENIRKYAIEAMNIVKMVDTIEKLQIICNSSNRTINTVKILEYNAENVSNTADWVGSSELLDKFTSTLGIHSIVGRRYDTQGKLKMVNEHDNRVIIDGYYMKYCFKGDYDYEQYLNTALKKWQKNVEGNYKLGDRDSFVEYVGNYAGKVESVRNKAISGYELKSTGEVKSIEFITDNLDVVKRNADYYLYQIARNCRAEFENLYDGANETDEANILYKEFVDSYWSTTVSYVSAIGEYERYVDNAGNSFFIRNKVKIIDADRYDIINGYNINGVLGYMKSYMSKKMSVSALKDKLFSEADSFIRLAKQKNEENRVGSTVFVDCQGMKNGLTAVIIKPIKGELGIDAYNIMVELFNL